jgi:dissimilatory sulfite reductase (desulfoviridin) alpha/beta subunit
MAKCSHEELQALKAQAMIPEKGGERFSVRLGVVGGRMSAAHLQVVASSAEQFGDGSVHFTTRQGVEIPHVPFENLVPLRAALEDAGLRLAATGRCVRSIIACPGSYCVHGVIDSQGLAQRLHARIGSRKGLPHKFKIAIAGCLNGCTKPNENDLGVMGRAKGFTVFVGGKMGKHPRWADILPLDIASEDQLFKMVEAVIDWFTAEGNPGERFGATIDRVGLERLVLYLGKFSAQAG